ncbi:MAG TPA: thiamine pyrophosphate-binding protein [Jatrophihabitans sp.]|nr:thiamine pyrophosphate-binding protein [Jatrophihabitans sp.]
MVVQEDSPRAAVFGRDIFFEYLVELGVPYIFGNPGTTEIPLIDGCNEHPSVEYVLSLHEDVAVAQAMGYARASGKIGVVNLHVTPGVAHGLGNLYNAYRARIPLLITAGQHHAGLNLHEPILTADLAALVRPFTKWSYEVTRLEELPIALQRAFKELTTPPYAPVFLSIATNLLLEKYPSPPPARVSKIAAQATNAGSVEYAAQLLAEAANPMILAGDGVALADGWPELVAIAEDLGAVVFTEGYATAWNFPSDHPQFAGPMPNLAGEMRNRFNDVDVVLMCGVTCQAPVSRYDEGGPLIPWRVKAISLDDDPWEVGKNQPVDVGLVGDVKTNLTALAAAVQKTAKDDAAIAARAETVRTLCRQRIDDWDKKVKTARESEQLSATLVAAQLRELMPSDVVFADESISNRASFVNVLDFPDPLSYFNVNGLSLGYSAGAAVGIQLARPERRVVNVVGDGSLMYYPQALWNAATAGARVLFVVLNNSSYNVLKVITQRMGGPWSGDHQTVPGLDIDGARIDFVQLAQSLGMPAVRPANSAELHDALERGLAADGPYLVEVTLPRT